MSAQLMLDRFAARIQERLSALDTQSAIQVDMRPLQKALAAITKRTDGAGVPVQYRDRIVEALHLLRQQGPDIALKSHLRYLCWGLCEPFGVPPIRVLDLQQILPNMLETLKNKYGEALLRPNVWRGLFDAYLRFMPHAERQAGHSNWLLLRTLLADTLGELYSRARFRPSWLQTLYEHPNLLGDAPCARYGVAVFDPDDHTLTQLRNDLQIPESSWFWSELLLAQVQTATAQDDTGFIDRLNALLVQIVEHPLIRDRALAALLTRYAESRQRMQVHIKMRDAVSDAWGSPHLERNTRWALTTPDAHQMVRSWLVVDALEAFFKLLQDDQAADTRRLDFWLRYQRSIEYFHFCLNKQAYYNRDGDYVAFRAKHKDLIGLFRDSSAYGNAFIFRIGKYYIVEFGGIGATYVYSAMNIPFAPGAKQIWATQLRDMEKVVSRLSHRGSWEYNYESSLAQLGIRPDPKIQEKVVVDRKEAIKVNLSAASSHGEREDNSGIQNITPILYSVRDAIEYARSQDISVDDRRPVDGALWIFHRSSADDLAAQLGRLGFKYDPGLGWRKN